MRWFAALLLVGVSPAIAQQQFRPRILLVFDTSGSMSVDLATGQPTGGDNSREYPGDGNTSRLFVAKNAISALVETTSEVDFALLRYPQREGDGINRGPVDGFQQNLYDGLEENPLNYGGVCSGVLRARDANDFFSLLVPFSRDNEAEIVAWFDHHEDWPADSELRADGPRRWATPRSISGRSPPPTRARAADKTRCCCSPTAASPACPGTPGSRRCAPAPRRCATSRSCAAASRSTWT